MKQLFTTALASAALVSAASAQVGGIWTQSADNTTLTSGSVACQGGGITDNSWWRKYDPILCGLTTDYEVTACIFGVENATTTSGSTLITVNIRQANAGFPVGGSVDPILDTTTVIVPDTDITQQTFVTATFPSPVVIPAGTCISVEVMAPNGQATGDVFFIGSNVLGEIAPGYISAAACGIIDPTDYAAIGFPGIHHVIDLDCNPVGPPEVEYICDPANPNSTGVGADLLFQGNRDQTMGPYTGFLATTNLPQNQFGYYLASRDPRVPGLPVSNGMLCLQGDIARLIGAGQPGVQNSGPGGNFQAQINTQNVPTNPNRAILPGETWYFQTWYRDQGPAGPRSNFSTTCCVPFF